jgi:hypothetical protein
MLFVFGSVMEVVEPLHRSIGRKNAKRERYVCDREDLGKNLVRPIQEYAEFSLIVVFKNHR